MGVLNSKEASYYSLEIKLHNKPSTENEEIQDDVEQQTAELGVWIRGEVTFKVKPRTFFEEMFPQQNVFQKEFVPLVLFRGCEQCFDGIESLGKLSYEELPFFNKKKVLPTFILEAKAGPIEDDEPWTDFVWNFGFLVPNNIPPSISHAGFGKLFYQVAAAIHPHEAYLQAQSLLNNNTQAIENTTSLKMKKSIISPPREFMVKPNFKETLRRIHSLLEEPVIAKHEVSDAELEAIHSYSPNSSFSSSHEKLPLRRFDELSNQQPTISCTVQIPSKHVIMGKSLQVTVWITNLNGERLGSTRVWLQQTMKSSTKHFPHFENSIDFDATVSDDFKKDSPISFKQEIQLNIPSWKPWNIEQANSDVVTEDNSPFLCPTFEGHLFEVTHNIVVCCEMHRSLSTAALEVKIPVVLWHY